MIQEAASVPGGIIAVVYIGIIVAILTWMLHVPQAGGMEQHVSRIHREAERFSRIVVPLVGDFVSPPLVALASQMAKFRGATLDVLYVVEVPLQLPIDAASDEERERASASFKEARKVAARYGVQINERVLHARQAGQTIVEYTRENNADVVLIADILRSNRRGTRYARSVEYVLENAPCEVIVQRPWEVKRARREEVGPARGGGNGGSPGARTGSEQTGPA